MKVRIRFAFIFLIVLLVQACNAAEVTSEIPVANTLSTPLISAATTIAVPTLDPLTLTALAQFFKTLEAGAQTPELVSTPDYQDCSGNLFFMSLGRWELCDGLQDPIKISSQSGQTWQFSYREFYKTNISHSCTKSLYQTKDEKFLFFSLDAECELIEPGFVASIAVFRMDLSNGKVHEILEADHDFPSDSGFYYTESISPTGRRLAYIFEKDRPLKLNLLDLQTGEKDSFVLDEKYTFGGQYSWSADGTQLVFMLESTANSDHFISMVYVDTLEQNSMVTFMDGKEYRWIMSEMEVSDSGVQVSMLGEDPLFYDVHTGILSTIRK